MTNRIKVIDGFRGVSILLVVLFHYTYVYPQKYAIDGAMLFDVPWGGVGVSIFFVVSGLVIMKSLEASSPKRFLISRVSRLYPAYLCCVVLTTTAILAFGTWYSTVAPSQFWANLTMFQYYMGIRSIDGVYWSLRVEMAFYAVSALIYFGLKGRAFWITLLAYTVVAFGANLVATRMDLPEAALILPKVLVFEFFHYFVIGIVSYKLLFDTEGQDHPDWLKRIFWLLLALSFTDLLLNKALYKFAAIATVTATLFVAAARPQGFAAKAMTIPPLQYLGKISYSLYLLHQVIGYLLMRRLQETGLSLGLAMLCAFAIVLLLTELVHQFVEVGLSSRLRGWLTTRFGASHAGRSRASCNSVVTRGAAQVTKAPSRILFIVPDLSAAGGVANYYRLLLPRLEARNRNFIVDHMQMPIAGGGALRRLWQLAAWLKFILRYFVYAISKRPVLLVCNPSLFRFCLIRDGFLVALMKRLNNRCRTLIFFRGWNIANEVYLTGARASHFTPMLFNADVVLCLTERSHNVLSKLVSPATDLRLFQTAVDPDLEAALIATPVIKKKPDSFVFLGNVVKEKGIFELLTAFRAFSEMRPAAKLTVYGKGAALRDVRAFIQDNALEGTIAAPGPIYGTDKHKVLTEAEVFILPSYTEGMPNAILEALAAECLVIGTPVGAMEVFINEGLIAPVDVKSSESILNALIEIDMLRAATDTKAIAKAIIAKYRIEEALAYFEGQFKRSAGNPLGD